MIYLLGRRFFSMLGLSLFICICWSTTGHAKQISNDTLNVQYAFAQIRSENAELLDEYKFELYFYEAIKLALEKSDVKFKLNTIVGDVMMQGRASMLIQDNQLDTHWLTTSKKYENELKPIRFPLLKGLIGWRLMLVHKDRQTQFSNITNLKQLSGLLAGQGRDWPDTKILEFNKLNVAKITHKGSIMDMLSLKRIDYYPRSVMEIWSDLQYFDAPRVLVDKNIAFSYPLAVYFFVNNNNQRLYDAISTGLYRALEDGSFELLFQKFFSKVLAKVDLSSRKIFYLENPYMTEETPLEDKRLWLSPLK